MSDKGRRRAITTPQCGPHFCIDRFSVWPCRHRPHESDCNMALSNNKSTYKLRVVIDGQYRPLIVRGRPLHQQPGKTEFNTRRQFGERHVDLWLDGSLYPIDPFTKKHPTFSSLKEILEFIGEGENGLLGYVKNVERCSGSTADQVREQNATIALLTHRIDELVQSSVEVKGRLCSVTQTYVSQSLNATKAHVRLRNLRQEFKSMKEEHCRQLQSLREQHEAKLVLLHKSVNEATERNVRLQSQMESMKKTPFGYRLQVRPCRDMHNLSQQGGHGKAIRQLARQVIATRTFRRVQEANACGFKRKRLCGDSEDQVKTGKIIASILSKKEMETMLSSSRLKSATIKMTNEHLRQIGKCVGPQALLATCDQNGITQRGYEGIYKKFKSGATSAVKGLRLSCLPKPHLVRTLREDMNNKLKDLVGDYYSLHQSFDISMTHKGKSMKKITLTDHNNFFCDLEVVQRTMVKLYHISPKEVEGKPLIFVMKMDKAEIIQNQKLERISITLMNRALDDSLPITSDCYFSVQSERDIWPVGCFQVPKENFDILHAIFKLTKIPGIIQVQECGQVLKVDGLGEFTIQWHLAGDMKTLKTLYGLNIGANATFCCIYCNQPKNNQTLMTTKESRSTSDGRHPTWSGGLFAANIPAHPILIGDDLSRWHPILPVPLDRVHICTMHALNRICEKILHMHFQFVWTMREKRLQMVAIEDIQSILSSIGMHGGDVQIFEDKDLSGKANSVPRKPSMSGAHAHKLFQPSSAPNGSHRVYQDLVCVERNFMQNGQARQNRLQVWRALEKLIPYFTELKLSAEQRSAFKTLVEDFGRVFISSFGEHSVTHYIHVLVKHGPFFVEKYGSLVVWSCQGMEYSHHAAKVAYHRHTQHGGSKTRRSPLLQMYEHWYRIIQHRFENENYKRTGHDEDVHDERG